jgi:hypothetical protein
MNLETDISKFNEALRKFQETSKRSVAQNLKNQARLLVVEMAKRTPPGDFSGGGWKRTAGEKLIAIDMSKIMVPSEKAGARTDPRRIHEQFRRTRGRVKTDLRPGKFTGGKFQRTKGEKDRRWRVSGLKIYIDTVKKRVGYMASGWKTAALRLGGSLPAWIMRHNAPGYGQIIVEGSRVGFEMANQGTRDLQGIVQRRASAALKKRYWQMIKQVDNAQKLAAKDSGFIVGGS